MTSLLMPPASRTAPTAPANSAGGDARVRDQRLREQCRQFEALLLGKLLQQMRATVPKPGGLFAESAAERMSREMYDERLCDTLARRGTLGVAQRLYTSVSRTANGATAAAAPTAAGQVA
jgi:flagellar protein FlgJ